jgi:DNA replication and repair protein RecF
MLKQLHLQNFRNYDQLDLQFSKPTGLTYLIGDNGQGKTNILEAIYLLALAKSFRTNEDVNLIKWEADFARVTGKFEQDQRASSLEAFFGLPPQPKRVLKKNDSKVRTVDFVGSVQIVFFHPEDINMLYLGPELRRKYLDVMNVQLHKSYFHALRNFKKFKEHRNALLKAIKERRAERNELGLWNEQLAGEAEIIYRERAKSLEFINQKLSEIYRQISAGKEQLQIIFKNTLGLDFPVLNETANLKEILIEALEKATERDLASEHTSIGPHRDDFEVLLNGNAIVNHASRGEFRSIVLALKLIEIEFFKQYANNPPLLLLDDVFSELDHQRQMFLLEQVKNFQTFITTTKDSAVINREKLLEGDYIEIKSGGVV